MPTSHEDFARQCSPFLDGLVRQHPDWLAELRDQGRLEGPAGPSAEQLESLIGAEGLDSGLRQFRNREMLRITWREINRLASLEATMLDLSLLAEICLQAAIFHHEQALRDQFGVPRDPSGQPQGLCVLALGKLGGHELNLSSDVDLVFAFPENGETQGGRTISNEQFFTRLARGVIRSLAEVTEHGFCFRVDTRLRPFGASGPLVCSFAAMEQYYQREGRDWERYALVKARPVAGDLAAGGALLARLQPFVYRRYIDFGAVEALHEMRESVRKDAQRRDRAADIKRGPGGIREIEFLVQAFQLLRAGREPTLRTPSLLRALQALEDLSVLAPATVAELRSDYEFLRRLENAIQALHDHQEHCLPEGQDLLRVARVMGHDNHQDLLEALQAARDRVSERTRTGFPQRAVPDSDSAGAGMWLAARNGAQPDGSPLSQALQVCAQALARQALSSRAAQRLDRFMPTLLQGLVEAHHPEPVLKDLFDLVLTVSRRSAYLSLLVQNPAALDRMVALFAASDWIAATVIRHPALLDELIDPALGRWLPDREEMDQTLRRMMRSHGDPETALSNLNHVKLAFTLRIAVAELENMISAQRVQRSLTDLAECVIESCYQLALEEVRSRHGKLPGPGLGIVGYGSLGAAELGYGSDLDLIFLYTDRSGPSDGPRPLAREAWFIKLARRLLSYLTTLTPSGRLYEVDTRLRPNGRAGLLVSSLSAFESYQKDKAWTWELQALCRGRRCAGDSDIGVSFSKIRKSALARPRDESETRDQILDMRQRWREAHPNGDPLKFGDGGLVDIGFVAQLGVLLNGASHPLVLEDSGTPEQLEALVSVGWLTRVQHETLSRAYHSLTRRAHMGLLQRVAPDQPPDDAACAELCRALLHGPH
jgi:glutamate-ammonia-ligase adenylyltransferase